MRISDVGMHLGCISGPDRIVETGAKRRLMRAIIIMTDFHLYGLDQHAPRKLKSNSKVYKYSFKYDLFTLHVTAKTLITSYPHHGKPPLPSIVEQNC
jgi:hypothetical protein